VIVVWCKDTITFNLSKLFRYLFSIYFFYLGQINCYFIWLCGISFVPLSWNLSLGFWDQRNKKKRTYWFASVGSYLAIRITSLMNSFISLLFWFVHWYHLCDSIFPKIYKVSWCVKLNILEIPSHSLVSYLMLRRLQNCTSVVNSIISIFVFVLMCLR